MTRIDPKLALPRATTRGAPQNLHSQRSNRRPVYACAMKRNRPLLAVFFFAVLLPPVLLSRIAGAQPVASFYYDERGNIVSQARDTNSDGKMDRWIYYNPQGQIERIEEDVNFDGKA